MELLIIFSLIHFECFYFCRHLNLNLLLFIIIQQHFCNFIYSNNDRSLSSIPFSLIQSKTFCFFKYIIINNIILEISKVNQNKTNINIDENYIYMNIYINKIKMEEKFQINNKLFLSCLLKFDMMVK